MKNKRMLYIDQLCLSGHINFNNIYIKALYDHKIKIDFAFKFGYEDDLDLSTDSIVFPVPEKYFKETQSKILHRFNLYLILKYIKNNINLDNYDFILFSSFEEISLFFGQFKRSVILIHHNNLQSLDNKIRRYFYKTIINKNINIVFHQNIKNVFKSMGVKTTHVVKHGFHNKLDKSLYKYGSFLNEIKLSNFKNVVFAPSSTSGNRLFFLELLKDSIFQKFLYDNNILFIIKGDYLINNLNNIKVLKSFLLKGEYEYLLLNSDIIIINYPKSFKYRTSGVFWECVANDKLCLLSKIDAFADYRSFMKYEPFFNTKEEFMLKIIEILNLDESIINSPFTDKNKLKPNFKELLSKN